MHEVFMMVDEHLRVTHVLLGAVVFQRARAQAVCHHSRGRHVSCRVSTVLGGGHVRIAYHFVRNSWRQDALDSLQVRVVEVSAVPEYVALSIISARRRRQQVLETVRQVTGRSPSHGRGAKLVLRLNHDLLLGIVCEKAVLLNKLLRVPFSVGH